MITTHLWFFFRPTGEAGGRTVLDVDFEPDASVVVKSDSAHPLTLGSAGSIQGVVVCNGNFAFLGSNAAPVDPSLSFISAPDSDDWYFGTGAFLIELQVQMLTVDSTDQTFISQYLNTGDQRSWFLKWEPDVGGGVIRFGFTPDGVTTTTIDHTFTPTVGEWTHYAADRDASGTIRVYVNGDPSTTATVDATDIQNGTALLHIGKLRSAGFTDEATNGYIDDIRIVKGGTPYGGTFTAPVCTAIIREYGVIRGRGVSLFSGVSEETKGVGDEDVSETI